MAQGKKSFIAYTDWKDTFDALPDDKAGVLIKFIYAYVNDENPETEDVLIKAVFANIKNTLKRDLKKWESQQKQRVEAAKKSVDVRKRNKEVANERLTSVKQTSTVNDNDNDSVSDTDTDNVNDFNIFWGKYDKKVDKKKCFSKWSRLRKHEKEKIFETLDEYLKVNSDLKYRKYPLTYLNGECWNDEIKNFESGKKSDLLKTEGSDFD